MPERPFEVDKQEAFVGVSVPRENASNVERGDINKIALNMLGVCAEAAREERRYEGLSGLRYNVVV